MIWLCRILLIASSLFWFSILGLYATPGQAEPNDTAWLSSRDILNFQKPVTGQANYPWLEQVRAIMLRSLTSPDQARDLVNLHNKVGTKAAASYAKYVGPLKITSKPEDGITIRRELTRSLRVYAQKETKGDVFPQKWKDGLRFQLGKGAAAASTSSSSEGYVHNGNPGLRYGLRLKSIEPSTERMRIAAIGNDYEYLQYAPKANLVYEVGEIYPDTYAQSYPVIIPNEVVNPPSLWQSLPRMPDFKFNGRMAPRGLPSPGSVLPPQSLFLDQSQGYYQVEAQLSGQLKQENVLHRFRLPLYGKMNYRQERNKDWQFTKSTFENLYSNDDGYAVHLERYHLEKRYQLGFQFHKLINHFELYAHIPDTALEHDNFWRQHRWETRFDFHF